jgi:predicted Zn-dependent peptidase
MDKVDPLAPMPAVAVGYWVPDPLSAEFWPVVVLGDILVGGEASRLYQRLVKKTRVAVDISGSVGPFGDPMEMRDPTTLEILAWHPGATVEDVLAGIDAEVAAIVREGLSQAEVDRVVTSLVSGHYRQLDNVLDRAALIGELELLRGDPSLVNEYPSILGAVTPPDVVEAARTWLSGAGRAVVAVSPAAA